MTRTTKYTVCHVYLWIAVCDVSLDAQYATIITSMTVHHFFMILFIPYFKTASAEEFLLSLAAVIPDRTRLQSFTAVCSSEISVYFIKHRILCLLCFGMPFCTLEFLYFIGFWNQIDVLHGKLIVMSKFLSGYEQAGELQER